MPPRRIKAVQLLVNSVLPDDLKGEHALDSKGIGNLMAEVAKRYPERYNEISHKLSGYGRNASYRQGETLTLNDMKPVLNKKEIIDAMERDIAMAKVLNKNPEDFKLAREKIWQTYTAKLQSMTMKNSLDQGNNLGYSVVSGARGKPPQLLSLITTPGTYTDANGKTLPLFIRNSYAEGLRPAEYLASTYGARKAVISTKKATAQGGFLAKQMVQATANVVVTENDCGANNGIDLDVEDSSFKHRVLAKDTEGVPAGTIVDRHVLAHFRKKKTPFAIVRSPMTCQSEVGVCSKCAGAGPTGKLYNKGESIGITGSQAIGEPITQAALNEKHTAGQGGGKKEYSGFDVLNRFLQVPEIFEDVGVVSEEDGIVESVEPAPQGGSFVKVGGKRHYILPGYELQVKAGQKVEAGDQLADGLVNPADIVRLKGLGEGRKYYVERAKRILDDSGMEADRRNLEFLSRGALDHVVVGDTDEVEGYLPEDVISYSRAVKNYIPPADTRQDVPDKLIGSFLQEPALHYTVGTRITPSVATRLVDKGFSKVRASKTAPGFEPEMTRLQSAAHNNPDWLASQHTSYLKKQLQEAATRGDTTNVQENVHFVPRLAIGEEFGEHITETGKF